MRGVSKPWPPRDVYPDGQAPASLREAEAAYREGLPRVPDEDRAAFARSEFDRLDKRKLRHEMYREQHSLCIYCEREVAEDHPPPRIDHWRPLSGDPALALHWRNLYLSCPTPETCDTAKSDRPLRWDPADPDLLRPVDFRYEDVVGFTSRGEIYVRADVELPDATRRALELALADRCDGTRVRRSLVNLNHPGLVKARAAVVASERTRMEKDFKDRTATRGERQERANQILDQERFPAFVSIRVAWLRKTLGRGRLPPNRSLRRRLSE